MNFTFTIGIIAGFGLRVSFHSMTIFFRFEILDSDVFSFWTISVCDGDGFQIDSRFFPITISVDGFGL